MHLLFQACNDAFYPVRDGAMDALLDLTNDAVHERDLWSDYLVYNWGQFVVTVLYPRLTVRG